MTETQWRVTWFPPDKAERVKTVKSEQALDDLLADPEVSDWHPIVEERTLSPWKVVSSDRG